ncbi:C-terminal processing protease CtpA/Prc, contains a PDZ domain [Zhouia amylolytica]|uniref:C-terminal processing protease CtpA/Prc, contains a PDZ domain n=1 Tax=Zhouia amylolytica TaxID=376730 RepID=A0A1I6QJU1_9FLAO|nr:S41 family peptidase [Zhouia amylolytica]MCQ0111229.1 hypothetical protein [Zhouia amylolytica]SFS52729.1 C-terminal processing protease CtpA/Prc, contains a PDZ domain [Zhouia amylolytica]
MKYLNLNWIIVIFVSSLFIGCSKDDSPDPTPDPEPVVLESEINKFVWDAMNLWYLWQDEVENLDDDLSGDQNSFFTFLNKYGTPEGLFEDITSDKDRFSTIVPDYDILFNSFSGVAKTNGIEFVLTRPPEGGSKVIGIVRYIVNGSDAEAKGIKRGDIFYAVNGTELFAETDANGRITNSNLSLLNPDTYTLNFATIENDQTKSNGVNVELVKGVLTENPIHISKTLDIEGKKIGYLMYNQFTRNFDNQLNDAFSEFKSNGVTDLVVDLRYNPGGSVLSATRLGSLITGQFSGQLFSEQSWNTKWNEVFNSEDLENTFVSDIDGTPLNSLNLSKVYIIATDDSASASELVINSLRPYIDVIHIGDRTVGKNEFSITLVDNTSQGIYKYAVINDASVSNANPNHKYALQPLVGTNKNANGFSEFTNGLEPDISQKEVLSNLGVLGDQNEPLLAIAIQQITGIAAKRSLEAYDERYQINTLKSSTDYKPYRRISNYDVFKGNK